MALPCARSARTGSQRIAALALIAISAWLVASDLLVRGESFIAHTRSAGACSGGDRARSSAAAVRPSCAEPRTSAKTSLRALDPGAVRGSGLEDLGGLSFAHALLAVRPAWAVAAASLAAVLSRLQAGEPSAGDSRSRRELVPPAFAAALAAVPASSSAATARGNLIEVSDPQTYSALTYKPPGSTGKLPLIVFLHGAGTNERDISNLADPKGEHGGLLPSLLATGSAPPELADNFAVIAPYSEGKPSFYGEPRKRVIQFIDWACSDAGREAGCPEVDPKRVFLFGFSDGATLGIELMTTRRYAGGVFAAFGFTGDLPDFAKERLKDLPIWMLHSADDGIFPVSCSDKFVKAMKAVNSRDVLRYTRYDKDQEGFTGRMKGHSVGITASRQPEVYSWLKSI